MYTVYDSLWVNTNTSDRLYRHRHEIAVYYKKSGCYSISQGAFIMLCSSRHFSGTVYFQQTSPVLIVSGFCVYSVASALFMFPAVYGSLYQALIIYMFERADSAGRSADVVIQSFVRFSSMALLPVIVCAGLLYLLVRNVTHCHLCVLAYALEPVMSTHIYSIWLQSSI